jgi:tRNA(Ile)-lysidine synthetase-like protein
VIVPGVDALRSFGTLLLMAPGRFNRDQRHYRVDLEIGVFHELPYGLGSIRINRENSDEFCANFNSEQYPSIETAILSGGALSGEKSGWSLYVRNWEPGDELQRVGHNGRDKLKVLFQEFRVLLWERRHWPVVVCGEDIIWARRFGCAAGFDAASGCRDALRLTYLEVSDIPRFPVSE